MRLDPFHPGLVAQLSASGLSVDKLPEDVRDALSRVSEAWHARDVAAQVTSFEDLVALLPLSVIVYRDEKLRLVNPSARRLLKAEGADDLVGSDLGVLIPAELREVLRERFAQHEGTRAPHEDRIIHTADGSRLTIRVAAARVVTFEGQPSNLVVLDDLTESRWLESRMQIADRMSSLGTMAAGVAHEINNPLAYILANVEIANEAVSELLHGTTLEATSRPRLEECRHALADAAGGARRVQRIVQALKTFSHMNEGHRTSLSVNEILESAIELAYTEIRYRADLVKDFGVVAPVSASEGKLLQVFVNLLTNAAQAFEGYPTGTITVRTRMDPSAHKVIVEVIDNAIGIKKADLPYIFEPFYTTKPQGKGTGLGLSICHTLVTALGGFIEVESVVGRGSTFRVSLPTTGRAQDAPTEPAKPSSLRRGRVLIIDDEPSIVTTMGRVLRSHEVVAAENGQSALRILASDHAFDIIICDLMMPDIGGDEVFERVCQANPHLSERFLFTSGGAVTDRARKFLRSKDIRHLSKPFSANELRSTVASFVASADAAVQPSD